MPPCLRVPAHFFPSGLGSPYWRPAGLGDDSVSSINTVLQEAGLPANQIQTAVQAYTGLDAASTNCVLGLVQGEIQPSFTALAPLISAGLLASGVGAPAAAVVAAALPVLDAIVSLFSSPQESCSWKVGAYCFTGKQPYGPQDPIWMTADQFLATWVPPGWQVNQPSCQWPPPGWDVVHGFEQGSVTNPCLATAPAPTFGGTPGTFTDEFMWAPSESPYAWFRNTDGSAHIFNGVNNGIDQAFPFYRSTIDCDLRTMAATFGAPTAAKPYPEIWGFLYVYYQAWRANAEFAINGYTPIAEYQLLTTVAGAWNKVHSSSSTMVLSGINPPASRSPLNLYPWLQGHYPNLLIQGGYVDNQDKAPITINLGPRIATSSSLAGSSSGLSTGAKVAIGAGVAAGGAALGVGLYALITKQGYSTAWDRLVRTIAKPFR